jgi:hypothetical protein
MGSAPYAISRISPGRSLQRQGSRAHSLGGRLHRIERRVDGAVRAYALIDLKMLLSHVRIDILTWNAVSATGSGCFVAGHGLGMEEV